MGKWCIVLATDFRLEPEPEPAEDVRPKLEPEEDGMGKAEDSAIKWPLNCCNDCSGKRVWAVLRVLDELMEHFGTGKLFLRLACN